MLRAQNLSRVFDSAGTNVHALDGVNLNFAPGVFVAVVGKSGSGKSTLLSLLGALDRPTQGTIQVGDDEITTMDDRALTAYRRSSVGFVFQAFQLIPNLSALGNVMLPMEFAGVGYGNRKKRAKELLDLVGLDAAKQERRPGRLSGGEQQRVAIARALANRPRVILADEPTGSLDKETGIKIIELLKQIARSEKAVVVAATHDEKIMNMADRSFQISDGRFVKAFTMRDGELVEEKDMRPTPPASAKPKRVAS